MNPPLETFINEREALFMIRPTSISRGQYKAAPQPYPMPPLGDWHPEQYTLRSRDDGPSSLQPSPQSLPSSNGCGHLFRPPVHTANAVRSVTTASVFPTLTACTRQGHSQLCVPLKPARRGVARLSCAPAAVTTSSACSFPGALQAAVRLRTWYRRVDSGRTQHARSPLCVPTANIIVVALRGRTGPMDEHRMDGSEGVSDHEQQAATDAYLKPLEFGARSTDPEARLSRRCDILWLPNFVCITSAGVCREPG